MGVVVLECGCGRWQVGWGGGGEWEKEQELMVHDDINFVDYQRWTCYVTHRALSTVKAALDENGNNSGRVGARGRAGGEGRRVEGGSERVLVFVLTCRLGVRGLGRIVPWRRA